MDGYITPQEYREAYPDCTLTDEQLMPLIRQASSDIDGMTFCRIRRIGFEHLTPYQQMKVKEATTLHAAFLGAYSDILSSPLSSYGINGVSMSFDTKRTVTQGGVTTSSQVYSQLLQSGLAHLGVW